jgi:hypothetical protein
MTEHNDENKQPQNSFEFMDGDVKVWIEQEGIHLLACDRIHRDPVELTPQLARRLADCLNRMADQTED